MRHMQKLTSSTIIEVLGNTLKHSRKKGKKICQQKTIMLFLFTHFSRLNHKEWAKKAQHFETKFMITTTKIT
jgi:hypothetical protein